MTRGLKTVGEGMRWYRGWTLLYVATSNGDRKGAELLLANKADVNPKDNGGYTLLRIVAKIAAKDAGELLCQRVGHEEQFICIGNKEHL